MATNRNKNTGNISAPQGANKNKGITSAIDQAGYRREFNERVFSDTGYIQSSIKDLQEQVSELEKVLSKSKELTKSEQTRYKNAVSNMKRLEAQLQQMYKSQDVSSNELFNTLDDSIKARQKAVDDLYKHYMNKEKEVDKVGKEQIDKKVDYFAAKTRELKGATEEIHEASEKFNDSQKSFSDGMKETVKEATNTFKDLSNMFNLQSIAQNQFLEKANERYDIINKMNSQLGYGTDAATSAYTNISKAFTDFNNQMGNLYNMNDMKQYLKDSSTYGLNTQKLLEDNMNSTIIAQKYLGTSSETLDALYKYMRLNNNNETINKYNKTLIALQKEGNGINKDVLDQIIMQNASVESSLAKSGFNDDQLQNLNEATTEMTAQILGTEGLGKEAAEAFNDYRNQILENFGSVEGWEQNAKITGMYSGDLINLAKNNPEKFLNTILDSYIDRSGQGGSDGYQALIEGEIGNQLSGSTIQGLRQIQEYGVGNLSEATDDLREAASQLTDTDTEKYVKDNTAISDNQQILNSVSTNIENFVGSWDGYNKLATTFFIAATTGNIIQGISGIIDLTSSIKAAGGIKNILSNTFNKFFGNSSTIGKSASNMTATGSGGKGLSMLATGTVIVGLAATTISALGSYFTGKREEAYANQYNENLENLKGTAYEGNNSVASADTITSASKSMTTLGSMWSNFTNGLGYFFEGLGTSDKITRNQSLTKWMYQSDTFPNRDAVMSWAILLDTLDSLKSLNNLGYNFSSEELQSYASNMAKEGKDNIIWNYIDSFLKAGYHPYKDNSRGRISSFEDFYNSYQSKNKNNEDTEGYHKAGLERVPKDNYRALLHKNEMVLNERDANEYRSIMEEAKKNNLTTQRVVNYKRITGQEYGTQDPSKNVGLGGPGLYNFNGHLVGIGGGGRDLNYKPYPITAGYPTYPSGSRHRGVDFGYPSGTPIGSASSGIVAGINADGSAYGNHVKVRGDNGLYYLYAHMTSTAVSKGEQVNAGQLLGYSGNTGNSTGPHLHYEVRNRDGKYKQDIDPYPYITSSLWSIGDTSGVGSGNIDNSGNVSNDNQGKNTEIKLATPTTTSRRAIPGIGGPDLNSKSNKIDGIDRIVNSVDGVSAKIIKYLDEIRQEQESQRSLIRAFSNSQNMLDMRN